VAGRQAVLFLKKKNQKNFCPFAGVDAVARMSPPDGPKGRKIFGSFFEKKEHAYCHLPSPLNSGA
jgi:hypothetical protein